MPRGRPKKIPYIKALEGNRSRVVIEDMGIDGLGQPFVAEHLVDDARGCIEVIKQSMPPRIYSALDSFLLAGYGMAWAIHKFASHQIAGLIQVEIDKEGPERLLQWVTVLDKQAMMMATLGDRLGLDPRSRSNLKLPNARQQKSKFEGLIAQRTLSSLSNISPSPAESGRANSSN
jgi:hypothetical protein